MFDSIPVLSSVALQLSSLELSASIQAAKINVER